MPRKTEVPMGTSDLSVKEGTQVPSRDVNDFYPTPWGVIIEALHYAAHGVLENIRIADIGMGSGRWGQVARHYFRDAWIAGYEIQNVRKPDAYDHVFREDVRTASMLCYDVILGNPPFYLFEKPHVAPLFRKFYDALLPGGRLIFLADQRFMSSMTRYKAIFQWWMPVWELKFVKRVSFYPEGHPSCGKTNAREHAIFVWEKENTHVSTKKIMLPGNYNDDVRDTEFHGTHTWQDMLGLGLVSGGGDVQEG